MDYSDLNAEGGFGADESPFADQHGNLPPQQFSQQAGYPDHTQDPQLQQAFEGVHNNEAVQHQPDPGYGGIEEDGGFRSPGFRAIGAGDEPFVETLVQRAGQDVQHPKRDGLEEQQVVFDQQPDFEQPSAVQGHSQEQPGQHGGNHTPARYHKSQFRHSQEVNAALAQSQGPAPPRSIPQYKLQAKITGLERTGRKDPILRFDVHTNLPKFRTTQFRDVRRTHPEFQKLAHHLLSSNPECIVPAVPPSATSAGVGTDEDEARVRAYMQRWLNYVCSNEVLMRDEEMVFFVESDFGYSPVVRRKQPATGVRRKVIKQFAPPPDDTPELEQARPVVKSFYLGSMETAQRLDRVVRSRRGLAIAESDFGIRMAGMATSESHPGLANAFRKLGRTIQSVGDFHAAQATSEATTLADPLNYHSSDAFIVKEILTNRQILMRDLETARKDTRSRLQTVEVMKGKGSIRREKVDEALQALEEAKSAETHLDQKVARVTGNLVSERRRWFTRTVKDMRSAIRDHCMRQIEAERRTLATLEMVRPDIRAIDSSGGLSRLGRDAPPAQRRASLAASQGPRGDSWSGVPRAAGVQRGEFQSVREPKIVEDEEPTQEQLDARSAASQLAGSTF